MPEVVHLTAETVKVIQEEALRAHGGLAGLRDEGLLDSAISATQASWGGEALFTDARDVAAAYLFYVCRNHPFHDGNKRAALGACLIVLKVNGIIAGTKFPPEESLAWEKLTLDVAAGRIDREETVKRLRKLVAK
ncbi:MAG TPA: Fic family protein [Opitutales bacterium]|nr:Fic family protein [Opitutales bacterium]